MVVIDRLRVTLVCNNCNSREESSALDKGSNWNSSCWNSFGKFKLFKVTSDGGGNQEPSIVVAKCKRCGGAAESTYAYS